MTAILVPAIFLATANDRDDRARYLRNLPEEARQVRRGLAAAEGRGHCELVLRPNATAGEILDVFQDARYRNRVAIFHFGGHADGYRLLLETADGKPAAANAGGLARFLAQQRGLQLVFLNGCSTQGQVDDLLAAGVGAVIATDQAVDDAAATAFAARFYAGLAGGATLAAAFHEAEAEGELRGGAILRHIGAADEEPNAGRAPWDLYIRPGAEAVRDWSLPQAVGDPLFGLPDLPPLDLPDRPFRYLDWYRREDAPIFFGRGRETRDLYDRVTAAGSAPIVLFYGQSGVGKSSLLAAGLRPRLEDSHDIRYARRDQALGLLGTLAAALGTAPEADLTGAWHKVEAAADRPLLIILDQVEELFTRPKEQRPDEMAVFLAALVNIFSDPARRPRGKLILSFRKEWLAEIEKRLTERRLPRGEVFLERLGREGITEVVAGPQSTPRLTDHYRLTVAEALPGLIADDLLADRESPVAPMLAILLADMWEAAKARSYDRPAFDENLYHEFRSRGLSLDDFLGRQLQALRGKQPAVVDSGLALDLLAYHTTPLGTAEQRTLADLEQTYRHRQDVLPKLLQELRDLYLLVDPSQNQPDQPRAVRLTHDTLAPFVRKRFNESEAPGQRARRILESRAVDWADGKEGASLDETDLTLVQVGESGMRSQKPDENRLVQASRAAQVRRIEEQRQQELALEAQRTKAVSRLRLLIAILTVLALIAPGLWLRQQILKWQAASPLIEVPATQLILGSATTPIAVPRYYMEKYEVSNKQYGLCVRANACEVPVDPRAYQDANFAHHPVVYVTAYQADNYCRWLGRRLPTSLEWLHVTRGLNGSSWPWGQEPIDPSRVNMSFINSPSAGTAPVDSYPEGRSGIPEGIYNLIGNVWEWTATPLKQDPYSTNPEWKEAIIKRTVVGLIVLGGAYRSDATAEDWTTMQNPSPPSRAEPWLGFRCAQ